MDSPAKPPTLDLNNTFGALLLGVFFSASLLGITCTQVFYYFQNYNSTDSLVIKGAVAALLIMEALHSAFGIHAMYYYLITNYLNPNALAEATWSATMTVGMASAIIIVVHFFYIRRVYYTSRKNLFLVAVLTLLATGHVGSSIAVSARAFQLKFFVLFVQITPIINASLAMSVATDVLIAVSLCYYLHTNRSGIEATDTLINKLMVYAVNNGILTSVFDILVFAFVTAQSHNLIYLAIFQVVGSLYTNSMLATLNSRNSLRGSGRQKAQVISGGSNHISMNHFKIGTVNGAVTSDGTMVPTPSENDTTYFDQKVVVTATTDVHVV